MWVMEHVIANIVSMGMLEKEGYNISYDTGGTWIVTTPSGGKIKFKRGTGAYYGIPYIDMSNNVKSVSMLYTVRVNYEGYKKKEVDVDILSHKVQAGFDHISDTEFKNMVRNKLLENFPVKFEHITNSNNISGSNTAGLRGKSVRTNPTRMEMEYIPTSRDFYVIRKFVTLKADVMFVNGLPFLIALSRKIKNFTPKYIPTRTATHISSSINKIVKLYAINGFVVNIVMMDMEFEKLPPILTTQN